MRLVANVSSCGLIILAAGIGTAGTAYGRESPHDPCSRPTPGSAVPEPEDLRSQDGVLKLELAIRNFKEKDGSTRYCYLLADGTQSPTLRLNPGDLLVLSLKNELSESGFASSNELRLRAKTKVSSDPCTSGAMTPTSTNLHFHGLTLPPVCHQDAVLRTSIQWGDPPLT